MDNVAHINTGKHTVLTSELFGHFGNAFNKLCDLKTLPPMVKYNLAKTKRELVEYAKAVESSLKVANEMEPEAKRAENEKLMNEEFSFNLNPINVKDVAELSANDIFNLKSLIIS